MVYIYILRLENGKYYIGKTQDPNIRINCHMDGNGSAWTKQNPPLEVIDIVKDCDDFDEDKYTKQYMSKYGIDNVRGGTYCQINLKPEIVQFLQQEIYGMTNRCYNCGSDSHFAKYCTNRMCERCGRNNHTVENCYARTHISGEILVLDKDCEEGYTSEDCEECMSGFKQIMKFAIDWTKYIFIEDI